MIGWQALPSLQRPCPKNTPITHRWHSRYSGKQCCSVQVSRYGALLTLPAEVLWIWSKYLGLRYAINGTYNRRSTAYKVLPLDDEGVLSLMTSTDLTWPRCVIASVSQILFAVVLNLKRMGRKQKIPSTSNGHPKAPPLTYYARYVFASSVYTMGCCLKSDHH